VMFWWIANGTEAFTQESETKAAGRKSPPAISPRNCMRLGTTYLIRRIRRRGCFNGFRRLVLYCRYTR
jgi:hypothetical protein